MDLSKLKKGEAVFCQNACRARFERGRDDLFGGVFYEFSIFDAEGDYVKQCYYNIDGVALNMEDRGYDLVDWEVYSNKEC